MIRMQELRQELLDRIPNSYFDEGAIECGQKPFNVRMHVFPDDLHKDDKDKVRTVLLVFRRHSSVVPKKEVITGTREELIQQAIEEFNKRLKEARRDKVMNDL